MTGLSRRSLLRTAGATLGAGLLPPSTYSALAAPPAGGDLGAVEHVVILMQENRSFDHYYGALRGVRGFDDRGPTLRNGRSMFEQPGTHGRPVPPFPIRDAAAAQYADAQNVDELDHSWPTAQAALAGGWNDGWVKAKTSPTMAFYDRTDIPFHYELADTFTICDHYHCSIPSSTAPNRNFLFSGTTGVEPGTDRRAIDNAAYDVGHPGYDAVTIGEILQDAGIGWQVYQEWDNFTDNNLEYFREFKRVAARAFGSADATPERFYSALADLPADTARDLTRRLADRVRDLPDRERELFERGLRRTPPGSLVTDFAADVARGALPQVSFIVAPAADSEHPSRSSPRASANLVYGLLDALARHNETWRSTALLLNYDENDGYFDHVPPPRPPRDARDEWYRGLPMGLGSRVPMTVISPWTVGGFVASETFDHTSCLRLLEQRFGIRVPAISAWRREICGDLTSVFDFAGPRRPEPLRRPAPTGDQRVRWKPQPPERTAVPAQEPGSRPRRPVPYRLDAAARLEDRVLRIDVVNSGPRTATVAVFPHHLPDAEPVHLSVIGHQRVEIPVTGEYRVTVLGSAGFVREFVGSAVGAGDRVRS